MHFYGLQAIDYGQRRVLEDENREFSPSLTSRGLPWACQGLRDFIPISYPQINNHIMKMAVPGIIHTLLKNKIGQNGS